MLLIQSRSWEHVNRRLSLDLARSFLRAGFGHVGTSGDKDSRVALVTLRSMKKHGVNSYALLT